MKSLKRQSVLFLVILFWHVGTATPVAFAGISDIPMASKVIAAAPNLMFVHDNSGSMDWEFMTTETDGKFENHEYVFDDPGDNTYQTGSNSDVLGGADRGKWKSQWTGYNKIYYNPDSEYLPWPGKPAADTVAPRSNPENAAPVFDLAATYHTVYGKAPDEIIVDELSAGFTGTGPWEQGTDADAYNNYYYWTPVNGDYTALWQTAIPISGTYQVHARWYGHSYRSNAVGYTVTHGTGGETVGMDQSDGSLSGQWNLLGEYAYTAGESASVSVDFMRDTDVNRMCADAVKWTEKVAGIDIKNAHYYTWTDLDENGSVDPGEVYLVNFVSGGREFYRFSDANGNDQVDDGELIQVSGGDIPPGALPKIYGEDGAVIRDKTDAEELRNFANWYSFYRRRELTAKAVVTRALDTLEGIYVGIYTINEADGVRQPVLPIHAVATNSIIVDNRDSGFSTAGSWYESGSPSEYADSSVYTSGSGDSARWTPNLPTAGSYDVHAWWNCYSNRDANAKFSITHSGGVAAVYKDQRSGGADGCGDWKLLGTYTFNQGTGGSVTVQRHGGSTGSSTNADAVKFESLSGGVNKDETDALLAAIYGIDSNGGTPLRTSLRDVGRYYDAEDGLSGGLGTAPWADAVDGGGCQQAFTVVMTDGYWNGSDPGVGNADGTEGAPYADAYADTLADVSMAYYQKDLVDALDDEVPANACDQANYQHMVTYTVSFGVQGTLTPPDADGDGEEDDPCFLDPGTPAPVWTNPLAGNSEKIDDLRHTAVNGRGLFFSATNPEELVASIDTVLQNIEARRASGASVSINGEELGEGSVLYQAQYLSDGWTGNLVAYPIDPQTGEVLREADDIIWEATDQLQTQDWDTGRRIVTSDETGGGMPFRYDQLTDAQREALGSDLTPGSAADDQAAVLLDYLRGLEVDGLRPRSRKLGDIVHSAPVLHRDSVYVGANDGMLHVFDKNNGLERFAYIPNQVYGNLAELANPAYSHYFYVDITPFVREVRFGPTDQRSVLIGGLGKGGKGYFALDVTDADTVTESSTESQAAGLAMWEFPMSQTDGLDNDEDGMTDEADETDPDMGYSFSQAIIVDSYSETYPVVVIFGNGYESGRGRSVLYIVDALTGTLIRKIDTGTGGGLSTPSVVDVDNDFKADYAYAGDFSGNMWKFDLTDTDPAAWDIAYSDGAVPKPLFQAMGQPVTTKPAVMRHCSEQGYIVVFGTGKYLEDADRMDNGIQTLYGIWDFGDDADDSEYLGVYDKAGGALENPALAGVDLLEQTVEVTTTVDGKTARVLSRNPANWATAEDGGAGEYPDPAVHAGWFFDFPSSGADDGERVIKDVLIRDGRVVALSFTPDGSPCSGGGNSFAYILDACTGGRLDEPTFYETTSAQTPLMIDVEGNPIPPSALGFLGMLHKPIPLRMPGTEKDRLYFSTSAANVQMQDIMRERVGMMYWREVDE